MHRPVLPPPGERDPEPLQLSGGVHKIYLNGLSVGEGLSNEEISLPRLTCPAGSWAIAGVAVGHSGGFGALAAFGNLHVAQQGVARELRRERVGANGTGHGFGRHVGHVQPLLPGGHEIVKPEKRSA